MTTGKEVFSRALALLGYTDKYGSEDSAQYTAVYRQGLSFINQVLTDLCRIEKRPIVEIENLDTAIPLSVEAINDVMPFGVAMYMAQYEGDMTMYSLYADLYSQKRGSCMKPQKQVKLVYSPFEWGRFR